MKSEYTAEKHQYKIRHRCPVGKACTCCDPGSSKGRTIEHRRVKRRINQNVRATIKREIEASNNEQE